MRAVGSPLQPSRLQDYSSLRFALPEHGFLSGRGSAKTKRRTPGGGRDSALRAVHRHEMLMVLPGKHSLRRDSVPSFARDYRRNRSNSRRFLL